MLKEGVTLSYDKGTILIRGLAHIPFATLDPRSNVLRAQGLYYQNIVDYLKQSRIGFADYVFSDIIASPDFQTIGNNHNRSGRSTDDKDNNIVPRTVTTTTNEYKEGAVLHSPQVSPLTSASSSIISLRDYQQKALANWIRAGMKGSVVLPTGAGKTLVGISAIKRVNASALIVVPTIDLMDQWTGILAKHLPSTKIGNLGGGSEDIQPITVSTYDSAYLRAPLLGNKFLLIIFDEVHHLAAPGYRTIAEQMAAPYRLGLTATIEREDELHKDLPRLVGDVVYRASIDSLAKKKHLAPYEVERRKVELLPEELKEYQLNMHTYRQCLHDIGRKAAVIRGNNNDDGRGRRHDTYYYYNISLEKLIMISGKNPIARQALLARNRAINIALNSKAKIEELKEILVENPGKKTIIFTQHNSMVYQISDKFLIPFITYKTNKEERQEVLRGFKEGRYMAIVTSKVLDEGVDVPDAELGIIVSGTGSGREFIQRLGRLLRPKEQIKTAASASSVDTQATTLPSSTATTASNTTTIKRAKLIEIISSETREESITSAKRKRALRSIRAPQQQEEVEDKEGQREVGGSLSC